MDDVAVWWYSWGVLLLLFVDIVLIAWLTYDSLARGVRVVGWLIAAALAALLTLPSLVFKFSSMLTQLSMADQIMPFFYLGAVGSIASAIISIAGLAVLSRQAPPATSRDRGTTTQAPPKQSHPAPPPAPPARPRVNAWLVDRHTGRNYQLCAGDSRIGRASTNDIAFTDSTVSREHILIRQEGSHFTLFDRGSRTGTLVNEQRVSGPVLLQHGDTIAMGDTEIEFVTAL